MAQDRPQPTASPSATLLPLTMLCGFLIAAGPQVSAQGLTEALRAPAAPGSGIASSRSGVRRANHAPAPPTADDAVFHVNRAAMELNVIEKFARVFQLPGRLTTVYGFDAGIVNITAVEGRTDQIRVHALKPGITQVVLVDETGQSYTVKIMVTGDVRHLQAMIDKLFPDANVKVIEVRDDDSVALKGWVTQPEHITYIVDVARRYYSTVLNHLQVGGVQQVMLRVKVMEVQRSRIRRLGMNFLYVNQSNYLASTPGLITPLGSLATPFGGPPAVGVDITQISNPTLSFGVVGTNSIFNGFVEALKTEGLLKIQAEPIIVTTNGRPARLINGGEFPILTPSGLGTVGIEWREFGVELDAVPIILGNGRLRLEISPRVSERDFTNSVNISGLTVPGLTVRGVNTQVEMRFGETLMIGGLIAHRHTAETSKVPGLGEMPWIGAMFSRKRYDEVETELVILVTPEYVAAPGEHELPCFGPGQSTTVPTDCELGVDNMIEIPRYGDECQNCHPGLMMHGGAAIEYRDGCPNGACGPTPACGPNGCDPGMLPPGAGLIGPEEPLPPLPHGVPGGMTAPGGPTGPDLFGPAIGEPQPLDNYSPIPPYTGGETMPAPPVDSYPPLGPTPSSDPFPGPAPAPPAGLVPPAPVRPTSAQSTPGLGSGLSGATATPIPTFDTTQPMPGLIGPGFDDVPNSWGGRAQGGNTQAGPALTVPSGL